LGSAATPIAFAGFDGNAIARAKARYSISGSLIEAANELSRGFTGEAN